MRRESENEGSKNMRVRRFWEWKTRKLILVIESFTFFGCFTCIAATSREAWNAIFPGGSIILCSAAFARDSTDLTWLFIISCLHMCVSSHLVMIFAGATALAAASRARSSRNSDPTELRSVISSHIGHGTTGARWNWSWLSWIFEFVFVVVGCRFFLQHRHSLYFQKVTIVLYRFFSYRETIRFIVQ